MGTVQLSSKEYQFLKLSMAEKGHRAQLSMIMSDGKGMLFSTNGFSIHAFYRLTEVPERGYYMWNKPTSSLYPIAPDSFTGNDLIKSACEMRQKYIDQLLFNEPLPIVSFQNGKPIEGLHLDQTAGKSTLAGFRKGIIKDKLSSVCVGVNYAPVEWTGDGDATVMYDIDQYISFDLKLLLGVMQHISSGHMAWRDAKSPALFGSLNGWHAIIMPMYLGGIR